MKYGFISIINQEVDLCEQVANINMSCPVEKGAVKLDHTVELPKEIPPVSRNPEKTPSHLRAPSVSLYGEG